MTGIRILVGAALLLVCMTSLVFAQNPKPPTLTDSPECDDCVTLIYNPVNGNLSLWVAALDPIDQHKLNSLEIESRAGILTGSAASYTYLPFDCAFVIGTTYFHPDGTLWCIEGSPHSWFARRARGFGNLDLEQIVEPNLTAEFLLNDLIIDGSYLTGGTLDKYNPDSPFLYVVPEPSAVLLSSLWIVVLLLPRWRR